MSSVNSQSNPEPLNFIVHTTKVGNKDCLEVGLTGLETKTYDVAATVFKDPTIQHCDSSQLLERIKYRYFVDTFFLSSGEEQLKSWEKLRPPYSDDVKEKLEQALKDPTNWSKIPPSLLTSSQLLEPLQKQVQEILLSQLDSNTIMFLSGEDEGAVHFREVFLNALKKAQVESNSAEVNRLTIAIKGLSQSDEWIIETLSVVLENAVVENAEDSIKQILAIDKPINLQSLKLAFGHAVLRNNQEMVRVILSRSCLSPEDAEGLRGDALVGSIQLGHYGIIREILARNEPIKLDDLDTGIYHAVQRNNQEIVRAILSQICLSSEEAELLRGEALVASIESNHLDIAQEILASNEPIGYYSLKSAIFNGAQSNNQEMVRAILSRSCLSSEEAELLRGDALVASIKSNHLDIAREILASNDPIGYYSLKSAIFNVVQSNNQEMVRAILSRSYLSSEEAELLRGDALVASIKSNHLDIAREILARNEPIGYQKLKLAIFIGARKNDNKDVIQAILARPSLSKENLEELYANVFLIATDWNQLDLAKAVSTQITKLDRDQSIQRSYVKSNREVFSLHLGLYNANEIPEDVFKSIVHSPDRSFSPDIFLELFLSDKLTESQVQLLRDEFKEYLSVQIRLDSSMEDNLIDKHQKINSILEQLSEKKIPYEYPFNCITRQFRGRVEFILYRQALTDFPKDFLNTIAIEGLPIRVTFLGELGIDAGGLFRDFIGCLIEGLNEQNKGIFNLDLDLGLPQLKESSPSDLEKTVSKADFKRFGNFLAKLYEHNLTKRALMLEEFQEFESEAAIREVSSPDVIGNCFDKHLFALLKLANNPKDLKDALKDYLKIRLFEKGALLGWAEKVPTSSSNVASSESWAVLTPKEYNNPSKGDKVDQLYVQLLEAQKSLKAIQQGQSFEGPDEIIARIEETKKQLVDAYVQAGNPRPTHCVFFDGNPTSEQMLLSECVTGGLRYLDSPFEELTGSSFDEKLNDYCGAIKEIRSGLEEVSPGFILVELEEDPIELSRQIQGEGVTIDSLMNSLELPQNAMRDMGIQKEWIREWLKKEPENLTKFIKSIAGVSQLPPGKNIKLINKDRIFIHTCFFSMDLYGQLPPQVTKETFFDRIEESLTNKRFEGY